MGELESIWDSKNQKEDQLRLNLFEVQIGDHVTIP
jgi:hypothetical protein